MTPKIILFIKNIEKEFTNIEVVLLQINFKYYLNPNTVNRKEFIHRDSEKIRKEYVLIDNPNHNLIQNIIDYIFIKNLKIKSYLHEFNTILI